MSKPFSPYINSSYASTCVRSITSPTPWRARGAPSILRFLAGGAPEELPFFWVCAWKDVNTGHLRGKWLTLLSLFCFSMITRHS